MSSEKNKNVYSPWMDNWKEKSEKPQRSSLSISANKQLRLLFWIGFFSLLVSPIAIIVLSTLIHNRGISEYKPAVFTKNDAKRLLEEAESAIHLGNYKAAIQRANYFITEDSDVPKIYILAGLASFYLSDFQETINYANEALKINPNYTPAKYLIAMCSYKINLGYTEQPLMMDVKDEYIYTYFFGTLYKELIKDYSGMLNLAKKGIKLDSNSPLMLYMLAKAQFRNSQFDKIFKTLNTLDASSNSSELSAYPIWLCSEVLKAEVYLKLGEYEKSENLLENYYDSHPAWWKLVRVYAQYYNEIGKFDKTIKSLKVFSYPKSQKGKSYNAIEMYQLRGIAQLKSDKLSEAKQNFENIIIIDTKIIDVDDYELLKEYFSSASHKAIFRIAQIEFKLGNVEKANTLANIIDPIYLTIDETDEFEQFKNEIK